MEPSRRHEPVKAQVHAPGPYADAVTTIATLAGLRPTPDADLALLVTTSQDPAVADRWLVDSLPHLVVSVMPDSVRVGPFVEPGITACLRCLLAADPGLDRRPPPPSVEAATRGAEQPDPALLVLALGWAARDLATWRAGEVPTTWSRTITLRGGADPQVARWLRHPHCGCAWDLLEIAG